jgi:hypothetical protein
MAAKKVYFKNSKGQRLVGIFHSQEKSNPAAVVMASGLGGDKDENGLFARVAEALAKEGYAILRFDYAGTGESEGRSEEATRKTEAEDLKAAISFMKKETKFQKLILIGLSMGAAVSTLSYSTQVNTMIFYSPAVIFSPLRTRYSKDPKVMKELKEKGFISRQRSWGKFRIGKALLDESENLGVQQIAKKVACPILIIHGSEDDVIRIERAYKTRKLFSDAELKIIEGADHNFTKKQHEKELIKLTLAWLRKHLK